MSAWEKDIEKKVDEINEKIGKTELVEKVYNGIINGELFRAVPVIQELEKKVDKLEKEVKLENGMKLQTIEEWCESEVKEIAKLKKLLQEFFNDLNDYFGKWDHKKFRKKFKEYLKKLEGDSVGGYYIGKINRKAIIRGNSITEIKEKAKPLLKEGERCYIEFINDGEILVTSGRERTTTEGGKDNSTPSKCEMSGIHITKHGKEIVEMVKKHYPQTYKKLEEIISNIKEKEATPSNICDVYSCNKISTHKIYLPDKLESINVCKKHHMEYCEEVTKPKESTDDNLCSNCGKLNDMCGVYLRSINLCDVCIGVIMDIVFEDRVLVKKEDLEGLNLKPIYTTKQIRKTTIQKPEVFWIKWIYIKEFLNKYLAKEEDDKE